MDDFKSKVLSGFVWEGSTKLIVQIVSWMSTILVARWLSPDDYGVVAVSGAFIVVLTVVTDLGLTSGLINKKEISRNEINGVFWLSLALACGLTGAIVAVAPFVEDLFDMDELAEVMIASSSVIVISSLRCVPTALVMRDLNYKYRALVDMAAQFAQVCTALPLAYFGYGPWSLVLSAIVMQLVTTLAYVPQIRDVGRCAIVWREIKDTVAYGTKVMVSNATSTLNQMMPTVFIGYVLGQKPVGEYSMADQLSQIPLSKVGAIFNRILFPAASRIKDDVPRSRELFFNLHRVLLMCIYPVLVGTAWVADDLVLLLFTEKWSSIVPILQGLCVLYLLRASAMIMIPMLSGMGMADGIVRYNGMLFVLIPVATLIGLQWGIMGMLAAWGIVHPIAYAYLLSRLKACLAFGYAEFLGSLSSVVVATGSMSALLFWMQGALVALAPHARLPLMIVTGALAYTLTYWLLFRGEVKALIELVAQRRAQG